MIVDNQMIGVQVETALTAAQIREIRQQYGLSQRSFALLLGIGPASIVRYEQGAKPSKANANLIRAARHPQFMLECLERDGRLLPDAQRSRATEVVYAVVSLDPEATDVATAARSSKKGRPAMGMDEMYELTLRQEILNEQAANIACEVMAFMIECGIDSSDEADPIAALLRQLFVVKGSITGVQCDEANALDEIAGYLRYTEEYLESLRKARKVA